MFQFNVKGCRLKIHFSLFALIAFLNLVSGVKNGMWMFAVILMHEGAHLMAMLVTANPPDGIMLSALGMRIILPKGQQLSYGENVIISLAGPVMNFICALSFAVAGLNEVSYMSLAMGIFHILPVEPLDGGFALHAFLSAYRGEDKAEKILSAVSLMFILPIIVLGFFVLVNTKYNFTLLLTAMYLMVYLVMKRSKFI